jgi:hypothetical protein
MDFVFFYVWLWKVRSSLTLRTVGVCQTMRPEILQSLIEKLSLHIACFIQDVSQPGTEHQFCRIDKSSFVVRSAVSLSISAIRWLKLC